MKIVPNIQVIETPEKDKKKIVPYLHVDADEDHVTLVGENVPLVSVIKDLVFMGKGAIVKKFFT